MADDERKVGSEGNENEETQEYDPRLDVNSEQFDPLLALNTPGFKVPDSSAKVYDNIALYHTATDKEMQRLKENSKKNQKPATVSKPVERRFQPHQMPTIVEKSFKKSDVFTKMDAMKGPLALLRKCKDERIKVKIVTRHQKGVRGYCLGYLLAFDKHWNVALEDVTEFWTRPKKRKVPALDSAPGGDMPDRRVRPPPIKVTPHETSKKLENCMRRVDQLMMRGEHIVLIRLLAEEATKT